MLIPPARFLYFAYGSNMLAEWMCSPSRCPSATRMGVASVSGFDLAFIKCGKDGSGKATLVENPTATTDVQGALYSIANTERAALRRTEGGYDEIESFPVRSHSDGQASAVTFIAPARNCDASRIPFNWYLELVTVGADQSGLSGEYIERLRRTATQPDPDLKQASVPRSMLEKAAQAMVNARR